MFQKSAQAAAAVASSRVAPYCSWRQTRCADRLVVYGKQKNEGVYFEYGPGTVHAPSAFGDAGQFEWVRAARKEVNQRRRVMRRNKRRRPPQPQSPDDPQPSTTISVTALFAQAAAQTDTRAAAPQAGGRDEARAEVATAGRGSSKTLASSSPRQPGWWSAPAAVPVRELLEDELLSSSFYGDDEPIGQKLQEIETRHSLSEQEQLTLKLQALGYAVVGGSDVAEDCAVEYKEGEMQEAEEIIGWPERETATTGADSTVASLLPKPPRRIS